ncbi:kinase-like domain-containing protein, partial [Amylostereum chailletii]
MVISHNRHNTSRLPAPLFSPEEPDTSPSLEDTPVSRLAEPLALQRGAYTVLRTLHHSPTSTLYLTYSRDGSPPARLFAVRAYSRPLSRQGHTEQRVLRHIASVRLEDQNVYLQTMCRSWEEETKFYLVTEHCEGGNLLRHVQSHGVLDPESMKTWASEIASGLGALHDLQIVHCALRPSIVLVRANGHVLISGFEHSARIQEDRPRLLEQERKSEWFHAPELLLGWEVGFEVDWWAYGIIVGWMACGQHPFHLSVDEDVHADIMRKRIMSGAAASVALEVAVPTVRDLIKKCLERNPAKRLGVVGVKNHAWFADIDWGFIARIHGPAVAISSPMPCYPFEDSPTRPAMLIPPVEFPSNPQYAPSSPSTRGGETASVRPAQLQRTHSTATIGTTSTASSHMRSAVLTRATRAVFPA